IESHSRHCSGLSSEPSSQSGSPSHCHRLGTHWPLLHTKSDSAHVFFTTEFFSSLPSVQSSSPSHFHSRVIHRPFVHWNWEASHLAFLPKRARPHSPAPVAPLSRGAQHSASSSQSAQRADVPMVPAWMVPPPPPLAPHNKLPKIMQALQKSRGKRRGERERGWGAESREDRRERSGSRRTHTGGGWSAG
uniref:Uncharacterized protein n=1 Tax=Capra hircus TaxID=9925 RepID=A0A8C2NMN6_CAPHI